MTSVTQSGTHIFRALDPLSEKDKKTTDLPRLIPQSQQKASGQRLIEEIKGRSGDAQPKSIPPSTPKEILEHSVFVTAPTTSSGCPQKVKVKVKLLDVRSAAEIDLVVFEVREGLGLGMRHVCVCVCGGVKTGHRGTSLHVGTLWIELLSQYRTTFSWVHLVFTPKMCSSLFQCRRTKPRLRTTL